MSTVAQIRDAIVALHAGVASVGAVHAYERYSNVEDKFRQFFVVSPGGAQPKQIRGWWWRRVATREAQVSTGSTVNVHTWQCRGYMALADDQASELLFDQLVEDVRAAFRAAPTLGGVCHQNPLEGDEDGVQVLEMAPVLFCGVLCHSVTLQLKTWSYV